MRTGLAGIDHFLGGLPSGIVDLYGDHSVGKTALAAQLLRRARQDGNPAILVRVVPLDRDWALQLGVPADVPVLTPGNWATAGLAMLAILENTRDCCIVVDSAAGLETSGETLTRLGLLDQRERHAELERVMQMLSWPALAGNSTVVLLSEERDVLLTRKKRSSLRVDPRRTTARIRLVQLKMETAYGHLHHKQIEWRSEKAKACPPDSRYTLHLFPDRGFDTAFELLKCWIATGQAVRRGAMWELEDGSRVGPGFARAAEQLRERYE